MCRKNLVEHIGAFGELHGKIGDLGVSPLSFSSSLFFSFLLPLPSSFKSLVSSFPISVFTLRITKFMSSSSSFSLVAGARERALLMIARRTSQSDPSNHERYRSSSSQRRNRPSLRKSMPARCPQNKKKLIAGNPKPNNISPHPIDLCSPHRPKFPAGPRSILKLPNSVL
jgi:hypothetical protein